MASGHHVVGHWRIVGANRWEADYLDIVNPAALIVRSGDQGEIAFGAMQAGLDVDRGPDAIGLSWVWFDETDYVSDDSSAEWEAVGSLTIVSA